MSDRHDLASWGSVASERKSAKECKTCRESMLGNGHTEELHALLAAAKEEVKKARANFSEMIRLHEEWKRWTLSVFKSLGLNPPMEPNPYATDPRRALNEVKE